MKIFAVYKRSADTCGNEDIEGPIGYCEALSGKELEAQFPHGFLTGYVVHEILVESVSSLKQRLELEKWNRDERWNHPS